MLKRFDKTTSHLVLPKKTSSSKKNSPTKPLSISSEPFDLHSVVQKLAIDQSSYKASGKRLNRPVEIDKKKLSNGKLNSYLSQILPITDPASIPLHDSPFSVGQTSMTSLGQPEDLNSNGDPQLDQPPNDNETTQGNGATKPARRDARERASSFPSRNSESVPNESPFDRLARGPVHDLFTGQTRAPRRPYQGTGPGATEREPPRKKAMASN